MVVVSNKIKKRNFNYSGIRGRKGIGFKYGGIRNSYLLVSFRLVVLVSSILFLFLFFDFPSVTIVVVVVVVFVAVFVIVFIVVVGSSLNFGFLY